MHLYLLYFIAIIIIIIFSAMGTRQGDHLGRALLTLPHFRALHSIANHFLYYFFPSITNDIHMTSPPSILSFAYGHF